MKRPLLLGMAVLAAVAAVLALRGTFFPSPEKGPFRPAEEARRLLVRAAERRERGVLMMHGAQALRDDGGAENAQVAAARGVEMLEGSLEDYDRAIALLEEAEAPPLAVARARSGRALVRFDLGHSQLALVEASEALAQVAPASIPDAHLARTLALYALGDFRASARSVELLLDPESPPEQRGLGIAVYLELSRWYRIGFAPDLARTRACLERAVEIGPSAEENLAAHEELRRIEEDFRRERADLEQRVASFPNPEEADLALAILHSRYGQRREADRLFTSLLDPGRIGRTRRLLLLVARHHCESRDTLQGYDEAERLVREALAADPADPDSKDALRRIGTRRRELQASLAR